MRTCFLQFSALCRASLLALVFLGLLIKPVLSSVFELHAFDHALAAHGDGPGHDPADFHDDSPSGIDDEPEQDHTQGAHGLLHSGHSGGAYSDAILVLSLPLVAHRTIVVPLPLASPVALQHITGPFRPPIA